MGCYPLGDLSLSPARNDEDLNSQSALFPREIGLDAARICHPTLRIIDEAEESLAVGVCFVSRDVYYQLVAEFPRAETLPRLFRLNYNRLFLEEEVHAS